MVTINFQAWKYGDSQNGCHHTSIPLKSRHHSSIEAVAIVPYPICHHMAMDLVTITIVTRWLLARAGHLKSILLGMEMVYHIGPEYTWSHCSKFKTGASPRYGKVA